MRTINEEGLKLIKEFEGLRLEAYLDVVGIPTIGYGSTHGVKLGDKITEEEAESLLKEDLKIYEDVVERLVKVPLTDNQFSALVSFTYNLGQGNLASSTLLKLLNKGEYTQAADQFLRWNKAGGKVYKGLTRRREAERELFLRQV